MVHLETLKPADPAAWVLHGGIASVDREMMHSKKPCYLIHIYSDGSYSFRLLPVLILMLCFDR